MVSVMRWLETLFIRRRYQPDPKRLAERTCRRLQPACQQLSEAERLVATSIGLATPPRLLLVDEEQAVILTPEARAAIEKA